MLKPSLLVITRLESVSPFEIFGGKQAQESLRLLPTRIKYTISFGGKLWWLHFSLASHFLIFFPLSPSTTLIFNHTNATVSKTSFYNTSLRLFFFTSIAIFFCVCVFVCARCTIRILSWRSACFSICFCNFFLLPPPTTLKWSRLLDDSRAPRY